MFLLLCPSMPDHHLTTTVQWCYNISEKPIVTTNNGLFLVLEATVQNQHNLRSNASLYRPVVVLRREVPELRIPSDALKKRIAMYFLQCAFWFDVILVSESLPAFGEDNFVDKEENHHRHAAVQNRRTDVINKVRHQQPGYGDPHAVDGVDNAGNDAECQHIPRNLLA